MTQKTAKFSERLLILIGKKSVSAFGRRCGIGESTFRKYLKGGMPGLDKLIAIAEAADVNIEWLATGEGPMRPGDKESKTEQPVRVAGYDNFRISEKMQKTIEILESETIYRPALAANIDAFHHGMIQEQVVQDQQVQIQANQKELKNLAARIAALEKHLSSATATPDNYQPGHKENNNEAA